MKIKYNITENRESTIKAFELKNTDEEYKFFYDETNNIRKFRFKEGGGLNIPIDQIRKDFVLGGVVHKKNTDSFDLVKLKNDLHLDKSVKEIKFKHIAKGDLLDCLKSEKLKTIFDWILANDLNIHFSNLNILYFSIVDIIDSCIKYYPNFRYDDLNYFKTVFYELAKVDLESFLKILHKYKYPNIQKNEANKFLIDIKIYIFKHKDEVTCNVKVIDEDSILILADILDNAQNEELVFIQNNKNYELIDGFETFYMRSLGLFKNSEHIFDKEENIIEYFDQFEFYDEDKRLNHFKFEESHTNFLIQLSDVVVGILGKYNEFINNLKYDDIAKIKNNLNELQEENFRKFFKLCIKAELSNKAFVNHITALTNIQKMLLSSLEFRE